MINTVQFLIEIINWTSPLLAGNLCQAYNKKGRGEMFRSLLVIVKTIWRLGFKDRTC